MSDLISRQALIDAIEKHRDDLGYLEPTVTYIKTIILNQPKAYDVDKVVKQLEEFRNELNQFGAGGILTDIMDVVKAGGL